MDTGYSMLRKNLKDEMSILDKKEATFWESNTTHLMYQISAQPLKKSQVFLSTLSQSPHRHPEAFLSSASSSSKCTANTDTTAL